MRKRDLLIFLYGFIAGIGMILFCLTAWKMVSDRAFAKYEHPTGFFRMSYPPEWTMIENEAGAAVIFYSKLESDLDIFKENVNIVIQDLSEKPMPLDQYTQMAINQMKVVFKTNLEVLESTDISLGGIPGHKFVFIGKGPDGELKFQSIWAVKGETAFQFTYTSMKQDFDKYIDLVNKMHKSFTITKW